MAALTIDRARELLNYDPETGAITWRVSRSRSRVGDNAGYVDKFGYRRIRIDGRAYLAHRLAFLLMTGRWPSDEIDHKDGNSLDNRWRNLREATRSQNNMNRASPGKLGRGVQRSSKDRYQAVIRVDGKLRHLGCFATAAEAHARYREAAKDVHGKFMKQA